MEPRNWTFAPRNSCDISEKEAGGGGGKGGHVLSTMLVCKRCDRPTGRDEFLMLV